MKSSATIWAIKLGAQCLSRPFAFAAVTACLVLSACGRSAEQVVEAPPSFQPVAEAAPPEIPKLPAQLAEVHAAVRRVFKDAAILDTTREPSFLAGDFNGDRSQDLAVLLRPASGKVSEINEEYPPWILNDLFARKQIDSPPLRIAENEVLLAIIHGNGIEDWRNSEATQTYLLKNAVGAGLRVHPQKDFETSKNRPQLRGDLIGEVLRGNQGYVYYDGANYSWYDAKTFRPLPEKRFVHPGSTINVAK